jgi:hypothetical protein
MDAPQFEEWSHRMSARFGYTVRFLPIARKTRNSARYTDVGLHALNITIPEIVPGCSHRASGSGKVYVWPAALQTY